MANVEIVDSSPKQVPRSNVWPVDRTRLPAGCIGWLVPVARNFVLPFLKLSSMAFGSPSGVRVAENVAVPAGSPPLSTIGNEPLRVVPFHVTSAGWSKSRWWSESPTGSSPFQASRNASGPLRSDVDAPKNAKPVPDVGWSRPRSRC